jgi:peptide/nickel transport system substrate-binding protein
LRKALTIACLLFLAVLNLHGFMAAPAYAFPPINEPYNLVKGVFMGQPETVDPAFCYDTASGELIFNVYETLLLYDGEYVDRFMPQLGINWTVENITGSVSPEGLPWFYRYTFRIRSGVSFYDIEGHVYPLSPEDVEYSFERAMVYDAYPAWMFYTPLLNATGADDLVKYGPQFNLSTPEGVINVGKAIDHAVESNDTHVWFNFVYPGIYPPFLRILCQPWSSILSKTWINEYMRGTLGRKDWSGDWGDYTEWINYHKLEQSPLDYPYPIMCGTGPYILDTLSDLDRYWKVVRNRNYWRGWPADFPVNGPSKPVGWVETFKVTWEYDQQTLKTKFLNGEIDICDVCRDVYCSPGIRRYYPLLPLEISDSVFFVMNVSLITPYMKVYPPGEFHEDGIPSDFFGKPDWGIHVRKGFAYAFNYSRFIQEAYGGEAKQPATAIIPGLPYWDPTIKGYYCNLTKAAQEFQQVPDLWDTGFTMTIIYPAGAVPRDIAARIFKENIEGLNPKFHINLLELVWSDYLKALSNHWLALFEMGWLPDFPDPHNFAYNFYNSEGVFPKFQGYKNATMDALVEEGVKYSDGLKRLLIYSQIQKLAVEDCPNVPLVQRIISHYERDWVVDWYYNPAYPGIYAYVLWKWYYVPHALQETTPTPTHPICDYLPCDVTYDGKVDAKDIGKICKCFGSSPGPPIHPRWCFRCDITNDRKVDAKDLGVVCKYFGKTSPPWQPPPPPPQPP